MEHRCTLPCDYNRKNMNLSERFKHDLRPGMELLKVFHLDFGENNVKRPIYPPAKMKKSSHQHTENSFTATNLTQGLIWDQPCT